MKDLDPIVCTISPHAHIQWTFLDHHHRLPSEALTLSLFIIGYGSRRAGRIDRYEGATLVATYIGYNAWVANAVFH